MAKAILHLICLGVLCFALDTPAFGGAGRTAAQFLGLGYGGRAEAMGTAFTAIDSDVMALLVNPAGTGAVQEIQGAYFNRDVGVRFGEAGKGIYYDAFGCALPLRNWGGSNAVDLGVISGLLQRNGQGSIAVIEDWSTVRQIDLGTNWALTGCYANKVQPNLALGISGKIVRQVLADVSATAYAVDLGLQYHLLGVRKPQLDNK